MDLEIIAPVAMAIIVFFYYLAARKNPKGKSGDLFWSIIHSGCGHCGGNFDVVVPKLPDGRNYVTLGCQDCKKQYRVNHVERRAWAK